MKKIVAFSSEGWPKEIGDLLKTLHIPANPLKIKTLEEWNLEWDFFLKFSEQSGLVLFDRQNRKIEIDFDNDRAYHRKNVSKKSDPLLKALGLAHGRERVWDLSAGLGKDSVMMAGYGLQVSSFERNPALYALLNTAADRSSYLKDLRLRFHYQDAMEVLKNLPVPFPENGVLFYDPMFPSKKKSALPPQEMVVLKELVGNDDDADEIIKKALEIPKVRLVVKRSDSAPPLKGLSHSILGKMVRFDVFIGL